MLGFLKKLWTPNDKEFEASGRIIETINNQKGGEETSPTRIYRPRQRVQNGWFGNGPQASFSQNATWYFGKQP